jgi:Gpi18-like mannosyltransferase
MPPELLDCGNEMRRYADLPWWVICVAVWLAAVLLLTAAALAGAQIGELREGYDPVIGVSPRGIPGVWARWDSPYYVDIAKQGYEALPLAHGFFPVYPLLMAAVVRLTGIGPTLAGMLIAQLSYLACLLLLYKTARRIRDEHGYAVRCVLAMALFPTSFFFLAVYAESFALAFSLLATLLLLRHPPAYVSAGVALGVAGATRPVGWLLIVVLLVESLRHVRAGGGSYRRPGIALLLSVSGIVAFVVYLFAITGTFLAIPRAQAHWWRQWEYPWTTLFDSFRVVLAGTGVPGDWFLGVINAVDLGFTLLALGAAATALAWSMRGRFPWSLSAYLVASLLFLLSLHGLAQVPLWGMSRWVAPLFPLYLVAGGFRLGPPVGRVLPLACAAVLLLSTAWWASGRWAG